MRPLANLGKELTLEAGRSFYNEVVAPELELSEQQKQAAHMRSRFNQKDLIDMMLVEMEEEIIAAQSPTNMVRRIVGLDPQIHTDIAALGDIRSQLSHVTAPIFQEPHTDTASLQPIPATPLEYSPLTVATMDA